MAIADITPLTDTAHDILDLRHRRRETAFHQFVQAAHVQGAVLRPALLESVLNRRERMGSTALGRGFALTGAWSLCVRRALVWVGLSEKGLDWDAADGKPVQLVACVLTPGEGPEEMHFRRLEAVLQALRLQRVRQRLIDKHEPGSLDALFHEVPR